MDGGRENRAEKNNNSLEREFARRKSRKARRSRLPRVIIVAG